VSALLWLGCERAGRRLLLLADTEGLLMLACGGHALQPWESGGSLFAMLTSDDTAAAASKPKPPRGGATAHFGDDDDDPMAKKVGLAVGDGQDWTLNRLQGG
jgi:hypothetical protein